MSIVNEEVEHQMKPLLHFNMAFSGIQPTLTFVLTTFNQESLVEKVINSIVACSNLPSELIIIDDQSEDKTLSQILKVIGDKKWDHGKLSTISVYGNLSSQFETFCDDFGIRTAKTKFVILVQSDVIITEQGFDEKLVACLKHFHDILMVSARGTEPIAPIADFFQKSNGSVIGLGRFTVFASQRTLRKSVRGCFSYLCLFSYFIEMKVSKLRMIRCRKSAFSSREINKPNLDVERPELPDFIQTGKAGYLSEYNEACESRFEKVGTVWLGQTVMRGPIALDRSKYIDAGGFDLCSTFLGFDDHEIAMRAYLKFKYRVGFVPIGYKSSLEWGNTRRPRSLTQTRSAINNCLRISESRKLTSLYNYKDAMASLLPTPEIREFHL